MTRLVLANCAFVDELGSTREGDTGLLVRDGSIHATGNADDLIGEARAEGPTDVIDLDGCHLLPGLINMHTHFGVIHPGTSDVARLSGETDAGMALRMAACARATVQAGVTTVRLVSERRHLDTALRSAIQRGETLGPRIFTAGQAIAATGGHGLGSHAVEVDGTAEARRATRYQIKAGADLIKVMISGGISDQEEGLNRMEMAEDELQAVIAVAHAWGKPVAGHLGGADVIDVALDYGIDSVEHGYQLSEQVARKMAELGTWLVPTMSVGQGGEYFKRIEAPGWLVDRLEAFAPRHAESVSMAAAAGVRILAGTDFVPSEPFDDTTAMVRELEHLVSAGLSTLDTLRAATSLAAECLGMSGEIGSITPNTKADMIVVEGNPTVDIDSLRRLRLVVADGSVVANQHLRHETASPK